jgi:CBS domain-containing protein
LLGKLARFAMKVGEVMTANVVTIGPEATLTEAARRMRVLDVGPLPVSDGGRLVGMLTDRDIAVRATAEGCDPETTRVSDVMTRDVVCCFEHDDVRQAARSMARYRKRRLVVVDAAGRVVGIVSLGDLALRAQDDVAGEALEHISQPL